MSPDTEELDGGGVEPAILAMMRTYGLMPDDRDGPADDDIVVRQSTIGSMRLCPARVGLSGEPGFLDAPSQAMFQGTVVHALIEEYLSAVASDGDLGAGMPLRLSMVPNVVSLMAELAHADGFRLDDVASDAQIQKVAETAVAAAQSWHEQVWLGDGLDSMAILAIEAKMVRPLGTLPDGRVIWLQGTADIVHGGGIVDWKTSSRGWKVNRDGLSQASFKVQAPLYLWLAEPILEKLASSATFYVYDVSKGQWTSHHTNWSEAQIMANLGNAWEAGKQIAAEAFPYTPAGSDYGKYGRGWWCSLKYCAAWNICPGKDSIADGVDTTARRDERWE